MSAGDQHGAALQPIFDAGSVAMVHGIHRLGYTPALPGLADRVPRPGIGGGINTVLPLVPQIGMMYLFLSSLRPGYMARAAL